MPEYFDKPSAASKRPLKVFLCHASADKPAVRDLYRRLVRDGVDVWMDETSLLPGMDWRLEIPRAVQKADAIIICLSNQSVTKEGYVQKEIRFALDVAEEKPDGTIYILPVRLDACEIPARLARWQWVDLFSSDGYRRLRISLRLRAEAVGAAIPSTNRKFEAENSHVREVPKQSEPLKSAMGKINFGVSGRLFAVFSAVILTCIGLLWAGGQFIKGFSAQPSLTSLTNYTSTVTPTTGITMPPTLAFSPTPFQPVVFPTATFPPPIPTGTFTFMPPPTQIAVPALSLTPSALPFLAPSMVLIPAGAFQMGREGEENDETPVHTVFLDAFYIDQYEVTNAMYHSCVLNRGCQGVQVDKSEVPDDYYGNKYLNYPVLYVSWDMAQAYCKWRGGRLPTEAEWEKAARGGLIGMIYPWGNEMPTCVTGSTHGAQFRECPKGTLEVGSFAPNNYQIFDMAGNVWEWVADWYDASYYSPTYTSQSNPLGPLSERDKKILRGGSWNDAGTVIYIANRGAALPDTRDDKIGFRCARNANP